MRKTIHLNDESDRLFIEPIPKWITRQGFILMIFIFLFLIISSLFVKYPQSVKVDVYISDNSIHTTLPFDICSNIKESEKVKISSPFHEEAVWGILEKNKAWGEDRNMVVPIKLQVEDKEKLRYKDSIICSGEIILSNKSIMGTIIQI